MLKLTFSYLEKMNVFEFLAAISIIINRIKDNPTLLPNPNPPIINMESQHALTMEAAEAAKFGDSNLINIRDERREVLFAQVVQQGGTVVGSNCTKIQAESLGFRVAKDRSPSQPVDAPDDVKATATQMNHGAEISWRRPKNARSFLVQLSLQNPSDPNAVWVDKTITVRSKVVLENLTTDMQRIWFRVAAFGATGQSPWSDPVLCAVV